ncbi:MAG: hypothetical protein IAF08_03715 [Rhizobacter sp.]|nr:hypothetical protein [Chlorobiales bacterium]
MIINAMRALTRPFKASEISTRIGNSYSTPENSQRAIALLYIERQTAQKRLDEVCAEFGYAWNSEKEVVLAEPQRVVVKTTITLKHLLDAAAKGSDADSNVAETIVRSEYGEATGDATKSELFKSASSDSFKRAASEFGIGRYLYTTPNVWFELENRYRFKESDEAIIARLYRKMGLDEHIDFADGNAGEQSFNAPVPAPFAAPINAPAAKPSEHNTGDRPAETDSASVHRNAVPATEKQVSLITKLLSLKDLGDRDREAYEERLQKGLSKKEASALIDELQAK